MFSKKEMDEFQEQKNIKTYVFWVGYFVGMATLAGILKEYSLVFLFIGFLVVIWIAYYIEFNKSK